MTFKHTTNNPFAVDHQDEAEATTSPRPPSRRLTVIRADTPAPVRLPASALEPLDVQWPDTAPPTRTTSSSSSSSSSSARPSPWTPERPSSLPSAPTPGPDRLWEDAAAIFGPPSSASASSGGPPPSSTPSASNASSSSTVCPKCSWHNPVQATTCAACGLIFAKFKARPTPMPMSSPFHPMGEPVDDVGAPAVAASRGGSDRSGVMAPGLPVHTPPSWSVQTAAHAASEGALSPFKVPVPVVVLALMPMLIAGVVGAAGAVFGVAGAMRFAQLGPSAWAFCGFLGLVAMVLLLRFLAASQAAVMITLDDVMDDTVGAPNARPMGEALTDGWRRSGSVVGVVVLQTLALLVTLAPIGAAASFTSPHKAIGLAALCVPVAVWLSLRLALALPAAILAGDGAIEALRSSWRLTNERLGGLFVGVLVIAGISTGIGLVAALIGVVPVVGWIVSVVVNLLLQGVSLGGLARLYRLADQA